MIFVCLISEFAQTTCRVREAQFSSLRPLGHDFAKLINTIYNSNRKMARKGKEKKKIWDQVYIRNSINASQSQ